MAMTPKTLGVSKSALSIAISAVYFALLLNLIFGGQSSESITPIFLCVVNYLLSLLFLASNNQRRNKLFFYVIYFAFFLVYIVKGLALFSFDLSSIYILNTIRTYIRPQTYITALTSVTIGHAILAFIPLAFNLFSSQHRQVVEKNFYWSRRLTVFSLIIIFSFVVVSALVMWSFDVAVMGGEGASLPYQLSGIFFFGRTICVPILLLFFIERCIVYGDRPIFMASLAVFLCLSVSDTFIRASKQPFILLALLLLALNLLLSFNGSRRHKMLDRRAVMALFVSGLLMFPIVEVYRAQLLGHATDPLSIGDDGGSFALYALERFFHRLLGFTQMAGVIEMQLSTYNLVTILDYGGFSRFYTEFVLGFSFAGHLSSPSLIGSLWLLGGASLWPIFFTLYIVVMLIIWRSASLLRNFTFSVRAMLSFEILNTMMAGSLDMSVFRIFLIFSFCICCEAVARALPAAKKHKVTV